MNIQNKLVSAQARRRAEDMLSRLTLEEKVRQLGCTLLSGCEEDLAEKDLRGGIGEIALMDIRCTPQALSRRLREVQQYVMDHSRLHIPALFHCEALSGPVVPDTCLFPPPSVWGRPLIPTRCRGWRTSSAVRCGLWEFCMPFPQCWMWPRTCAGAA